MKVVDSIYKAATPKDYKKILRNLKELLTDKIGLIYNPDFIELGISVEEKLYVSWQWMVENIDPHNKEWYIESAFQQAVVDRMCGHLTVQKSIKYRNDEKFIILKVY